MFARLRSRLTYANVVATLALFIALGGSAVAASSLFSGRLLKPRSVPGTKIVRNSLTKNEVRESSLGKIPNADKLDSLDSTQFLRSDGKAVDADRLDGIDSSQFLFPDGAPGRASDASRLGGLDPVAYRNTCPSNHRLFFSVCFENGDRTGGTFAAASSTCANLGGRLPTIAELEAIRQQTGFTLGGNSGGDVPEWSANPADVGPESWWGLKDDGTLTKIPATDAGTPYRCAFTPSG
ncbi:MAG: hypothetical protein QOI98_2868 [Solirubrobacteraceae bacterium]|jgi:hypothetical protein|nr:hypothetical protein [Solirubrobacteraceae bacterium]